MNKSRIEMIGKRFGRLIVVSSAGQKVNGLYAWKCHCNCGRDVVVNGISLRQNKTKSCGCLQREIARVRLRELTYIHGLSKTPEYRVWDSMTRRCKSTCQGHEAYFDRGIRVCDEWAHKPMGFLAFSKYMGKHPGSEFSLDRINNDGNYEPGNVRWATVGEQLKNRRPTKRIDQFTDRELADEIMKRNSARLNAI